MPYFLAGILIGCKKPFVLGKTIPLTINKATGINRIKSIIISRF